MSRWITVGKVGSHVLETSLLAATAIALFHRDWPLATLVAAGYVLGTWADMPFPTEVGVWVLVAAVLLSRAHGELAVFLLTAQAPLIRSFLMVTQLARRFPVQEWEEFYGGTCPTRPWRALVVYWHERGDAVHNVAWAVAVALGIAWPAGILWLAYDWHSPWTWPYLAAGLLVLLGWLAVGLRRSGWLLMRHTAPARPPRGSETSGSPAEWRAEALHMRAEFATSATGMPPAGLDLDSGFDGPGDPRLRLFAADCAEHILPGAELAGANVHGLVTACIVDARRRARGQLYAWPLRVAFRRAGAALRASGRRLSRARGDQDALRLADDAAGAAYAALCAPAATEAARLAANCAAIGVDGGLREDEHRWQLERLDWHRAHRDAPQS